MSLSPIKKLQQQHRRQTHLLSFPDELLLRILCHLSLRDLQKCSQSCKHLHSLLSEEDDLSWKCLFFHRFELEKSDSVADAKSLLENLSTTQDHQKKRWRSEYFSRLMTNEKWLSSRVIVRPPKEPHSAGLSQAGVNSMETLLDFSSKHILVRTRSKKFCRLILDPFDGVFPIIDLKPLNTPNDNLQITCFAKGTGSKVLLGYNNGVVVQCDWRCSNEFPLSSTIYDNVAITHLKPRQQNEVIAVGDKKIVSLWSFKRKTPKVKELEPMPEHCGEIVYIDIASNQDIVAVTNLGYWLVWSTSNDSYSLKVHPGFSSYVNANNPFTKVLIRGSKIIGLTKDKAVRVWNTAITVSPSPASVIYLSSTDSACKDAILMEANTQMLVLAKDNECHFWKFLDAPKGGACFEHLKTTFTAAPTTKVTAIVADKCLLGVASSDGRLLVYDGLKADLLRSIEINNLDDAEVTQIGFDWLRTKAIVAATSPSDGCTKVKFVDFLTPTTKGKASPSPSKSKEFAGSRKLIRRQDTELVDDYYLYLEHQAEEEKKRKRFEQRFGDLQMSYQEQLQYVMLVSQQEALTATSRATGTLEDMSEEEQLQYALLISQQSTPTSPGGIGVCS